MERSMDSSSSSRKSNKIRDIVRLQQLLKKWKIKAAANTNINKTTPTPTTTTATNKSIKFLKKTLSFSESSSSSSSNTSQSVPKGYVAVCVGKEVQRFVIPTEYLRHRMFGVLLREAEEEFGFQQEGLLRFPCEVELFQKVLKMMEDKRSSSSPSLLLLHDQATQKEAEEEEEEDKSAVLMNFDNVIINCSSSSSSSAAASDIDATVTADQLQLHPLPQMCR